MPAHPLKSEWDADLRGGDPLSFPGYHPPEGESVLTGLCEIPGFGAAGRYAVIEGRFDVLGGSMGAVHGERVVRAFRRATEERLPVVALTRSGGARMQEGMVSLVQMARAAAAARTHARAGLLSLAVLRGPTTGGVYASYGSLTDLRAARRGALIGFAGPRVVELTTGERLPDDSHTAEYAYRHGLVDALVDDDDHERRWIEAGLGVRDLALAVPDGPDPSSELAAGGGAAFGVGTSAIEEVRLARQPQRPSGRWWAATLTSSWVPLHAPDPCISAGLATLAQAAAPPPSPAAIPAAGPGTRAVVVAMDRRRPTPVGYRLAQRAFGLATRLGLPVLTVIDTPGADPGPASEAAGVAAEIARTFAAMSELPAPAVALCVGEGGSGGALALAFADRLLMLEHAVFSVIAPEGAAAILDRTADPAVVADRAEQLRLTARELVDLGVADAVVGEHPDEVAAAVAGAFSSAQAGERLRRFDRATARWLR